MAQRNFKKEEFVKGNNNDRYRIEFKMDEIGEGVDLVIEKRNDDGEFEIIQPEISRMDNRIFIFWSEPINGRIVSDEYKQL
ncbi:hypothetical protein CHRYSEOSP005_26440 [Chryseobacterium sp. Alg-005]|uniref:glutathione synthase n=1 Tax=Chryseobacterium sp. Alg-005 TaxID=3159516 RepID=UPI00355588C1